MYMVMIVYNQAIDEEIMELLAGVKIDRYTKWQRVLGKGEASNPRLDSPIWPGANMALGIVLEDRGKVQELVEEIKKLDARVGDKGLFAFMWPVEGII
ncbi:MAG: transcriptional regulator [Deltaproteobacteria bacterium]|nr:MAG: transcriptional regulator [Deltaproteobacteria bacterium]